MQLGINPENRGVKWNGCLIVRKRVKMNAATFINMNYTAVIAAGLIYFLIGTIWYSSPRALGGVWMRLNYFSLDVNSQTKKLLGISILSTVTAAFVLSCLITVFNASSMLMGLSLGILGAVGFMGSTVGMSYMFVGREVKLKFVDAGYHLVSYMTMGLLLSFWR